MYTLRTSGTLHTVDTGTNAMLGQYTDLDKVCEKTLGRVSNHVRVPKCAIACRPMVCHGHNHRSLKPWAWAFFKLDLTVTGSSAHTV